MRRDRDSLAGATHLLVPVLFLALAGCGHGSSDEITIPTRQEPPKEHQANTTQLVRYGSLSALEADLEAMLTEEMEAAFDQFTDMGYSDAPPGGVGAPSEAPGAGVGAPAAGDEAAREEGTDYSGTNNQERGVDEADFVKTDGFHIYALNGNRLHIFGVPAYGDLVAKSQTQIEGQPTELLVDGETARLAVFSLIVGDTLPEEHPLRDSVRMDDEFGWYWRTPQVSKVSLFDVSDPTAPVLLRELYLEGDYQTARLVGSSVRLGTYAWMDIPYVYPWYWFGSEESDLEKLKELARQAIEALTLTDLLPQIYERLPDGTFITHSLLEGGNIAFYRPRNSHSRGVTSVGTIDLTRNDFGFDAQHIITTYPTFYASAESLYIAESVNDWWWFWQNADIPEQLNIHKLDTRDPASSRYVGSGRVQGVLHNSFSLDEHDGYLRVTTTQNMWGRWWGAAFEPPTNHVYVLQPQGAELVVVGHLGGVAENENLFAARFEGDKGFLVTFEQKDPLFTLDLSDPTNPRVVGELEVPGFSTYIHPIAGEKLLTVGVGGDERGANGLTQVAMFDVANFAAPSLVDTEAMAVEGAWSWSEAQYEHKAFQYWAPKRLLAVPVSAFGVVAGTGAYAYLSRLELIKVDTEAGLEHYGTIDHSSLYNSDPQSYWCSRDIRRSVFMGDYVYAVSDRGITVHDLSTLTLQHMEALPGYVPGDYYWWW
ncbi:MAG: beta-propeller domain-containing protein [Planctomycetota bacterium]